MLGTGGEFVAAHHSFEAEFDKQQPVTLTGIVSRIDWVNPHVWIHLDVKSADGKVARWVVEAAGPQVLLVRGWQRDSLKPGATISVAAFRAKDGTPKASGRDITLPDGQTLCANIPCRCCHFQY